MSVCPRILSEVQAGSPSVVQQLHKLLNTIAIAITDLGQKKQKDTLICFTMGDEMWDQENLLYGPLSLKLRHDLPCADGFQEYFTDVWNDSEIIEQHIQAEYPPFYNVLINNFRTVRFTTLSSLGTHPTSDGQIPHLSPTNVFDPLLTLLRLEGHL